nr:PREDICTED: estrogen sulfotransferase, testis isoform-like [Megachile rotundata]XP_012143926.1 PREDICTED: estrogen sulfotransferase, testis isoform-like [Megachile rotundata]XP_012143927.1 PREDICTED: estrogen sulfotransferase, testis isoform-like [Megachile rotundata]
MASTVDSKSELNRLLHETFTSPVRKGYITVQGFCLPERYQKFAQAIEDFEVKDDDVWVCSFPKTGTTWTQEMIWCIANNADFEKAKVPLNIRFPFLEFSALFDFAAVPAHPEMKNDLTITDSVTYTKNQTSPRFIKTHLPFRLLPRQIRTGEKKPKIIYVCRNPKDTCISYYYHCKLVEDYRGDFNTFCRLFLGDTLGYTPYWDNLVEFWHKRNEPNILFLKYEDMKADLSAVIKKSAAFLNKSVSDDQMKLLLDHLSFASMKANPAVNYEHVVENIKKRREVVGNDKFIRSGKVGQWKEEMPENIIQQFDKMTKEKLSVHNLFF